MVINMDDWRERLAGIDDEYLIGISNKGIVKRAYKDKDETAAEIVSVGDEALVKVGGESVTVRFPLGESKCTCPSRSICRHVVQAILTLKESSLGNGQDGTGQKASGETSGEQMAAAQAVSTEQAATAQPQTMAAQAVEDGAPGEHEAMERTAPEQGGEEKNAEPGATQQPRPSQGQAGNAHKSAVLGEINAYPFARLKKALGSRPFQTFVNQVAADIRPTIQYGSVVTVQLPEPGMTAKLLSPLEYSTCTCHKKELCRHKAAAILWCQLEAGTVRKEDLLREASDEPAYDMDEVREAARQMGAFLEELFATGLSRVSPDVPDFLERLAIIGHNAGLARFEGYFRALADSYDRYLKRKAAFRTKDLIGQMTRLYSRVKRLEQTKEVTEVAALAGEFRADYLPVGNLDLIGIAAEKYKSQTGYEGETIYFLEEKTKQWYTYTNARPVFYDTAKRSAARANGAALQGPAPWGLEISMEKLLKVRIHLTGAKCDRRNRLSSSQETKGEITGEQGLGVSDLRDWYYRDFGLLFQGQIGKREEKSPGGSADSAAESQGGPGKATELVFVQPDSCAKAEFSQTGQQLTLPLYDRAGRELLVEVTYSKEEAGTIRYLERVSEKKLPCFLGKVSLRDGRLRMYPVDLLEIDEPGLEEDFGDKKGAVERGRTAGEAPAGQGGGESSAAGKAMPQGKDLAEEKAAEKDQHAALQKKEAATWGRRTKFEVMEDIAGEILLLMEDLCQSGFDTVHDSTLKDLQKSARLTGQYGMQHLSGLLGSLADDIETSRHQMKKRTGAMAGSYAEIIEYMDCLKRKTAYDRGADYYVK